MHDKDKTPDSTLSSSSSEIMGTPFDLGTQRFEYPFPQSQGSPTDPFPPAITSHSHAQLAWPIHISKSFPLTPPPLGRFKAHPKLRPSSVREPPIPPALVKRRSRVQHQSSSEEPSDKSDVTDEVVRARKSPRVTPSPAPRFQFQSHTPSEIVPMKHVASLPIGSYDRPTPQDTAGFSNDAGAPEPRPPVVSASAYTA